MTRALVTAAKAPLLLVRIFHAVVHPQAGNLQHHDAARVELVEFRFLTGHRRPAVHQDESEVAVSGFNICGTKYCSLGLD